MGYEHTTFLTMKNRGLARLGNSAFWSADEMGLYINEALRVWHLLTGYWSAEQAQNSVQDQYYYTTNLVTTTFTDQELLNEIQYHLLETPNNGNSMTSDMWTVQELIAAINANQNWFSARAPLILNRGSASLSGWTPAVETPVWDLSTDFPDLIDIYRASWDGRGLQRGSSFWLHQVETGTPDYYIMRIGTLQMELHPAPTSAGTLELIYTEAPTYLSNTGVTVSVPDDFSQYIKWGALSDLLKKEGQSHDPVRARYAEMRLNEGITLARTSERWMDRTVRHDGNMLIQTDLHDMDFGSTDWESESSGTPYYWFPVGVNQFGIWPADDSNGANNLLVAGTSQAPQYSTDGSYVDISEELLDTILDYVQHIASFKQGVSEFQDTMPQYQSFIAKANEQNSKLMFAETFRGVTGRDLNEYMRPLLEETTGEE